MSLIIAPIFLLLLTVAYAAVTGVNMFTENIIEDKKLLFFHSPEREDLYNNYNNANFSLAIAIFVAVFIFTIYIGTVKNFNLAIVYTFVMLFLLLTMLYYIIISVLTFFLVRMNINYTSTQAIINGGYAFALFIFSIIILTTCRKEKLKIKNVKIR